MELGRGHVLAAVKRLGQGDASAPYDGRPRGSGPDVAPVQLPYLVELWDEAKTSVEAVLAVARTGGIGYAAFYAAIKDYPDRRITLRFRDRVLTQFNGPGH